MSKLAADDLVNQWQVTFEEIDLLKLLNPHPEKPLERLVRNHSLISVHAKEYQIYSHWTGIDVAMAKQLRAGPDLNPQLLSQFPLERAPTSLASLNLPSRKLPLKRKGGISPSLANEQAA